MFTSHRIENLHYAAGPANGPRLIFLHGVVRRWQTFLPLFPVLSQRHQIQALDFRGHGESGRAANYQVMDYVEDAIQLITSAPGDVYLYGHSLGAMVAAAAAAQVPNRVRGLILEDPPFETMGSRIADSPLLAFFSAMRPFASCGATTAEIARQFGGQLVPKPGGGQARVRDLRDPVSLRFTASALQHLDPAVLDAIVSGNWLARYHWEQILRAIPCPTLFLQADPAMGGMLTTADVESAQQWMADLTVMSLPCGHVMHWAQSATIAQMSSAFFETC